MPRGRPPIFVGPLAEQVARAIAEQGIAHAQLSLAHQGINISRPTLGKLAKIKGIKLHRGRRKAS